MTKSIFGFHVRSSSLRGAISIEFQMQSFICLEQLGTDRPFSVTPTQTGFKEYVASIIGLYKNNGAVSCIGNYFPFIQ